MNQTPVDYNCTTIATKLQHINGDKMYMFENNLLKVVRLHAEVPHATDVTQIVAALNNTASVNTIEIDKYSITGNHPANILQHKTQLQELCLSRNCLQGNNAVKVLLNTVTLKVLFVCDYNITIEAADYIAAVISHNIHLQEFDISGNNIQTVGTVKIVKALKGISTLQRLCFSNNNITDEAADEIAAAVSCNSKLQEIDLKENDFQTNGIVEPLQNSQTLTRLYISNNNVTDEAANDIAATISCNVWLQEVDVSGNNLNASGAKKLLEVCRKYQH